MITILFAKFKINEPKTPVIGLLGRLHSIKESEGLSGNRNLIKHFENTWAKSIILIGFYKTY